MRRLILHTLMEPATVVVPLRSLIDKIQDRGFPRKGIPTGGKKITGITDSLKKGGGGEHPRGKGGGTHKKGRPHKSSTNGQSCVRASRSQLPKPCDRFVDPSQLEVAF